VDLNRLRRLAAEVDDEHREAMRTIHDQVGDTIFGADEATRETRRGFLRGLGLGGAVVTVGTSSIALSSVTAAAQTTTTAGGPTTTAAPTTTTTSPPKQAEGEDLVILAYAQSLELAAVEVYKLALPKVSADVLPIATAFGGHHEQHAQAISGLAAKAALGEANRTVVNEFGRRVSAASDQTAALRVAFELETAVASTYLAALGELRSTNPATSLASILPIEARHAVVLGQAIGLDLDEISPTFETTDDALPPADNPIIER
jgi:hypothetical protein